jgi:exodeoxyribonuclease III
MLKLFTWNVNGIRAVSKKGFLEWFETTQPDILALQETKADTEIMRIWWDSNNPKVEEGFFDSVEADKQTNIFANYELFWHSCSVKKGYSGTAIFYRKEKFSSAKAEIGLGIEKFDQEGRTTVLHTDEFTLINCYYPQGGRDGRIPYKLEFYNEIINLVNKFQKQGKKVILCGDLNTTRTDIDLARPKENRKTTGCLPEEREVLERLIAQGCDDAFRYLHPDQVDSYTYWDQITRARDRNVGWRIDYFLVDTKLLPQLVHCSQLDQVFGSDHCPVEIHLDI